MKRILLASIVLIFLFSFVDSASAQQPVNYQEQYNTLYKEYAKDHENIANLIAMATFFADTANPQYNLAQAGSFIRRAETIYTDWVAHDKHYSKIFKLMRNGISLNSIRQLHATIDSAALSYIEHHSSEMTEAEMSAFVETFRDNKTIYAAIGSLWTETAYQRVCQENTVQAYYSFIVNHPNTAEAYRAEQTLQNLAPYYYAQFSSEEEIKQEASKFPKSEAMQQAAMIQQSRLAFTEAARLNTASAYKAYLDRYPKGDNYVQALMRHEALSTNEFSTLRTPQEYADFAEQHSDFSLADTAMARLRSMILVDRNATAARIYLDRFPLDPDYSKIYKFYYSWFSEEGNCAPIARFIEENPHYPYRIALQTDLQRAQGADSINLLLPYREADYATMSTNIYKLTGKKVAFVALQRILQQQLDRKEWINALKRMERFSICFEVESANEFHQLSFILSSQGNATRHNEMAPASFSNAVISPRGNRLFYTITHNGSNQIAFAKTSAKGKDIKWVPAGFVTIQGLKGNPILYHFYDNGRHALLGINGDIYSVRVLTDTLWQIESRLPAPVNTNAVETDAYMLPDGSGILLASDRPGGHNQQLSGQYFHGDTALASDLYFIPHTQTGWGTPVNLGINVNTPYSERSPLLSHNMKTLYFISDGHTGMGYGDIFCVSRDNLDDWTHWSTPVNLGRNVNSPWHELSISFADNEQRIFATANTSTPGKNTCFSFATQHDTSDVHRTIRINLQNLTSRVKQIIVTDPVQQAVVQTIDNNHLTDQPSVRLCKGKRYFISAVTDSLFVPSQMISPSSDSPVTLTGYTVRQLNKSGILIPLNNVSFAPNTSRLLPLADTELASVAHILSLYPNLYVEIVVNSDGNNSKTAYNLSLEKAYAIRSRLIQTQADTDRILLSAYGNVNYKNNTHPAEVAIRFFFQ